MNMIFVCKSCNQSFGSTANLVDHFNLKHRVSKNSYFTRGVANCNAQFLVVKAFDRHVNTFHSNAPFDRNNKSGLSAPDDNPNLYKCPFPQCTYTATNKDTIRSHRFRKHASISLDSTNNADSQSTINSSAQNPTHEPSETHFPDSPSQGDNSSFVEESAHNSNCDPNEDILHLL